MVSGSSALALRTRVNLIVAYKVVGALILVPLFSLWLLWVCALGSRFKIWCVGISKNQG